MIFRLWITALFLAICPALMGHALANQAVTKIEETEQKVIFFDVNETLLDLESMRGSVSDALGGRDDLLPLWFSTMLHYSLVDTVTDRYHHFGDIGVAALMMVAKINNIELTEDQARTAIVTPLRSLPPHPDVIEGLESLKAMGYTLVSLTNSSNKGVFTQFENAGLTEYFDRRLSIEDIEIYKPHLKAYHWAAEQMEIQPEDALMVAAHGWDIAGAKAAGMKAAFITRPGKVMYPLAIPADYVVNDLHELADTLRTPINTSVFQCENGWEISFTTQAENTDTAQLDIQGKRINMHHIRSASGARYGSEQGLKAKSGLVFWNKGNDVTLYEMILDDSTSAADYPIITRCTSLN